MSQGLPDVPDVHDHESAVLFIGWCVARVGLGYHPDTPFSDYTYDEGRATFAPAEALLLDGLTEQAFAFCDPHAVALQEARHLAPAFFRGGQQ